MIKELKDMRQFNELLLLLFIGIKLSNFINWSWWWVMAPLWTPPLIGSVYITIFLLYHWVKITIISRKENK